MKTNGNDLAHPFSYEEKHDDYQSPTSVRIVSETGLTKRELFAAMAMQGILSNSGVGYSSSKAVQIADELIKELNKPIKG